MGRPMVPLNAASRFQRREERRATPKSCTADTERCQVARSYLYDLPECCRSHTRNLVFTVGDAMTAAGVRWWLDYGSLLGAVRNPRFGIPGGIIPHDKDADLGFLGEDWPKLLQLVEGWSALRTQTGKDNEIGYALGFQWIHKIARRRPPKPGGIQYGAGDSVKVRLSAKNHSNVDIFPWYDRPYQGKPNGWRHRYHFVSVDRCKGREFPEAKLLPLQTIEWEGRQLPCPADPEWFCAHRYGRTWGTPLRSNNDRVRR